MEYNQISSAEHINPNVIKLLRGPITTFYKKIKAKELVGNTVEILAYTDDFDPNYEFIDYFDIKKAARKYIEHEKEWYLSLDRSIIGHAGIETNPVWQSIASKDDKKEINSQYGWIVFSPENGNLDKSQYELCKDQLIANPNTRQAGMIYIRPSIWKEYNENGKNDFICTIAVWCEIRNNRLDYIVLMRSNDFFTGYMNDWAWHYYVYHKLFNDLKNAGLDIQTGRIRWSANSFHVYEKDFDKIEKIYKRFKAEEKIKQYYIYKITNLENGKIYIGKHHGSLYDKYYGSSLILNKRKIKFEEQNSHYIKSILEIGTEDNIDDLEQKWIKKENSLYPNGYNLSLGGDGGDNISNNPRHDEIINKIRAGIRKRYSEHPEVSKEHSEKMKGVNNPMYGRNDHSYGLVNYGKHLKGKTYEEIFGKEKAKELKDRLSVVHKGRKISEKTRERYRLANLGKNNPSYKFIPDKVRSFVLQTYEKTNDAGMIAKLTDTRLYDVEKILKENNLEYFKRRGSTIKGKNNPRYYELDKNVYEAAKKDYFENFLYLKEIRDKYNISIEKFTEQIKQEGLQLRAKNQRRKEGIVKWQK